MHLRYALRRWWVMLLPYLSACSSLPPTSHFEDEGSDKAEETRSLGAQFGAILDNYCPLSSNPHVVRKCNMSATPNATISDKDTHQTCRHLRLIRAQWFLAAAARFGAARIPEYSSDRAEAATQLRAQLLKAMAALDQAQNQIGQEPSLFELARADLVMASLRAAYHAVEPIASSLFSRIVAAIAQPDTGTYLKAARRLIEDRVYLDAYRQTCREHMDYVVFSRQEDRPMRIKTAWEKSRAHLVEQCGRVAKLTEIGDECKLPEQGQVRTAQQEGQPAQSQPGQDGSANRAQSGTGS